ASRDLAITVAEIEADQRTASSSSTPSEPARAQTPAARTLGLAVSELTEAQKRETGVKGGVVVDVATEAAERAGIREGDVIVAIGNTEVNNVREFEAAIARVDKTKAVPVLLRRGEL